MDNLILAEAPHLVVQGEGPHMGQKMYLFRVKGCPVQCEGCDSAYTFQKSGEEGICYSVDEFQLTLESNERKFERVMVSGGEPALYVKFFEEYFKKYSNKNFQFEIETSGWGDWSSLLPWWNRIHFNFSPKIGALQGKIKEWPALANLPYHYCVKVVTSRDTFSTDVEEIIKLQSRYTIPSSEVYLMPLGTTRVEMVDQSAFVLEKAMEHGYQFSPRLHILIYDNKRLV